MPSRQSASGIGGVLFDFAGTLLVPRPPNELLDAAATAAGLDLAPEVSKRLADAYLRAGVPGGPYPRQVPERLIEAYETRDLSPEAHRSAYVGLFEAVDHLGPELAGLPTFVYEEILHPQGWIAYAEAAEVVEQVAERGTEVGLVSNVGFDIRPILSHHGFGRLVPQCTLSFEVGSMKPDPAIFQSALRRLGTAPDRTLMVGDHEEADGAAAAVGMRTLILPMTPPGSVHGLQRVIELLDGDHETSDDAV